MQKFVQNVRTSQTAGFSMFESALGCSPLKLLLLVCVLAGASGFGSRASAASCTPAIPFRYEFQNDVTASLGPSADGSGNCALSVSTLPTSRTAAAGVLHYRRGSPLTTVRYGFRVDTSALSPGTSTHVVQLFSAASPVVIPAPTPRSNVLDIVYIDSATPALRFVAASDGPPVFATQSLTQAVNVVRVEITVGTGSIGKVRYWINHDFSDTPDGILEKGSGLGLNNDAFQGVIGAAVGLSNATPSFRSSHAGQAIVIDEVESDDDVLFYDDFSSGAQ